MVEAAGVEPASENVTGQENYMLSRIHAPGIRRFHPTQDVRGLRSEPTRNGCR